MQKIWIDAVEFDNYGGWRPETQFIREMGQAYLIANQVPGVPVENASTEFIVDEDGYYRFFVRTKNWKYPEAPGKFNLKVDGAELKNLCGKMPALYWYWEIADEVYLKSGKHTLEVCDKTGWLSRFADILITNDLNFTPSPEVAVMLKQRAQIKGIDNSVADMGEWDYIVVGAGPGGVGAAISAARNGLKTALICGRPHPGGNASDEGCIGFDGASGYHEGYHETGICDEVKRTHEHFKVSWQGAIEKLLAAEDNITLFENELCIDAECENNTIKSISCVNTITLKKSIFKANLFADCTGDGWLGYYAGAEYRVGRDANHEFNEAFAPEVPDTLTMSGCICDSRENTGRYLGFFLEETDKPVKFDAPDWAVKLPVNLYREPTIMNSTEWWLENSNDFDDIYDCEFTRDELVRLVVGYYDWLKNSYEQKEKFANRHLISLAMHLSKRENRRIIGDYILNQNDFNENTVFDDAVSYSGWRIDIHHTRGIYSGKEGAFCVDQRVPITPIPYRCLYSANINNLFVASRCASFSHVALGSSRVEGTLNTLGQAIGVAAALCKKYKCNPRDIYKQHISELQQNLLKDDQTIFGIVNQDVNDLALTAKISATSQDESSGGFAENIINGKIRSVPGECNAWISNPENDIPQSITLELKQEKLINEVHITVDTDLTYPFYSFQEATEYKFTASHVIVECFDGNKWTQVFEITDNYRRKIKARFKEIKAQKVRITVAETSGSNCAVINEVRIYGA